MHLDGKKFFKMTIFLDLITMSENFIDIIFFKKIYNHLYGSKAYKLVVMKFVKANSFYF